MPISKLVVAALMLGMVCGPALAQNGEQYRCYTTSDPRCSGDYCGNTFYNPTVSLNWQNTLQAADPNVMRQMAGVYYGEQSSAQLGMINRVYRSYEANGLWQYQDETCSNGGGPCSHNQGAGQWAGYQQADGTVFLMIHFSDLARTNTCVSQTVKFRGRQMMDEYGMVWQRVR